MPTSIKEKVENILLAHAGRGGEKGGELLVGVEEESITCNLQDPATASIHRLVYIKFSFVFYFYLYSNFSREPNGGQEGEKVKR